MCNRLEKLKFYSRAPRAGARKIHQVVDGDFRPFWLPTLRGRAVTLKRGEGKFLSRPEAVQHAREFRAACRTDLAKMEGSGDE